MLCVLLWYGTVYLVYTETVQDLLLNAVALKFVLEAPKAVLVYLLVTSTWISVVSESEATPAKSNGTSKKP